MLSRIAESLFWIGRYVERAEDTARILDVQTQMMVEDPTVDIDAACRTLLSVMGAEVPRGQRLTMETALFRLAFDTDEGTSITSAIAGARESARRARETLSTDLWEVINSTYRFLPSGRFRAMRTQDAFRWVRERAAVINGTASATMSRDEGWHFLVLGRSLERADMTARLVATSALSPGANSAWPTTLRACGAYQSFLRAYRGRGDRPGGGRVPPARPAVPALGGARADPGRAVPGQPGGRRAAGGLPGRGAAAARPGPGRAGVPLASATSSPTCPGRWSGCSAPARRPATRSRTATSRTRWR